MSTQLLLSACHDYHEREVKKKIPQRKKKLEFTFTKNSIM